MPDPIVSRPQVMDIDPLRRRAREAAMLEAQVASELSNGGKANGNGTVTVNPGEMDAASKAEFAKLLGSRSGGAYIPPKRLEMMQKEASKDKRSAEYQRLSWDALRKSINGLINKVGC